jgi:N,N-dimethylformamidase
VYLAATATYLAYANQRFSFTGGIVSVRKPTNANDIYLLEHPELGHSLYDYHRDGSGVLFSSRLRPILNLKPKGISWSFTADTNVTAWLDHIGEPYDVITDEDLHGRGVDALAPYAVVVTGTHPEYYSTAMRDALGAWLEQGGRLMYMGGNGFYWRIAYAPDNPAVIEVRRAEDGTRAWIAEPGEYYHAFTGEYGGLWRRLGRPPNQLVGVGFAAQGFDGGTYYRLQPGARDPRVAFMFDGLDTEGIFGNHGTQGRGAAGEEIDRWDEALGSPHHAVVVASSERHKPGMLRAKEELHMMIVPGADPDIRADLTFFETAAGGAVFSTGSISYAGSLSTNRYDNDVARLTRNVLVRFIDPTPFEFPS